MHLDVLSLMGYITIALHGRISSNKFNKSIEANVHSFIYPGRQTDLLCTLSGYHQDRTRSYPSYSSVAFYIEINQIKLKCEKAIIGQRKTTKSITLDFSLESECSSPISFLLLHFVGIEGTSG